VSRDVGGTAVVCSCAFFAAMHDFVCCVLRFCFCHGTRRTVGDTVCWSSAQQSCFRVSSCVFASHFQHVRCESATYATYLQCHCHCATATVPHCTAHTTMSHEETQRAAPLPFGSVHAQCVCSGRQAAQPLLSTSTATCACIRQRPRHRTKRGDASHAQIKCVGHVLCCVFLLSTPPHTRNDYASPNLNSCAGR